MGVVPHSRLNDYGDVNRAEREDGARGGISRVGGRLNPDFGEERDGVQIQVVGACAVASQYGLRDREMALQLPGF